MTLTGHLCIKVGLDNYLFQKSLNLESICSTELP